MKCPNCGNELKEDHLICEVCGEEIQMVPDFEPEIENSITETLTELAAMQGGNDEKEADNGGENEEEVYEKTQERTADIGKKVWVVVSLVSIFLIALISYRLYSYHIQTIDYQIAKAREHASAGEYDKAISYLESVYEKDPTLSEVLFMIADYYYLQENNDAALTALLQIIDAGSYSYEDVEEAYSKAITIYENQGKYEEIDALLHNCSEESIVSLFQGYMAREPEFNYVEGSYAEVIPLKLSSNTSGTIYYTMDGTVPNENSPIYTAPLFLETGEYTISAFFVNDYGIKSSVVTKKYTITLAVPNAPEIDLYSGEYTEPTMITVNGASGCSIYYTTDESDPTRDSVPYTGPIPMPLGRTVFKFVSISEEGVSSEVTMRTYILRLSGAISTGQAVTNLLTRLTEIGYLEDAAGHTTTQSGTLSYQFSSVLRIGADMDYYTIYEYYDDGTGVRNRTDKVFLVDVYSGECAQLGYDEEGNFMAVFLPNSAA